MSNKNIKAGDTVKAYDYEWEVLDTDYNGGILCLSKESLCEKAFDKNGSNYYPESSICKYLAELSDELARKGAEFKTVSLGMRADDGTGWDKEDYEANGLFLLTEDMYKDYKRYISDKSSRWWLATAYSFSSGDSRGARYVNQAGSLDGNYVYNGYIGVAPACIFSFLPEKEDSSPIEELKRRIADLEKRVKELEG